MIWRFFACPSCLQKPGTSWPLDGKCPVCKGSGHYDWRNTALSDMPAKDVAAVCGLIALTIGVGLHVFLLVGIWGFRWLDYYVNWLLTHP